MAIKRVKPKKPRGFPLTPMSNGQWAKRIRGHLFYFGVWEDPQAALDKYFEEKDARFAGREPKKPDEERLTIPELCNLYLESKEARVLSGERSHRNFRKCKWVADRMVAFFGHDQVVEEINLKQIQDYRSFLAKGIGVITLTDLILGSRSIFKYANDSDLIPKPIKYGQEFELPEQRLLRAYKQSKPAKFVDAHEIRALLENANVNLRAMILLGINCGFGQTDCSDLPLRCVNLKAGWIDFPRPKTAVPRRAPLWKETIEALQESLRHRRAPASAEFKDRFFISKAGVEYVKFKENGVQQDSISAVFNKLSIKLGLRGDGRTFYALRHTFETIAGRCRDQIAVDLVMGHVTPGTSANYRSEIGDDRLIRVTDTVYEWLWPKEEKKAATRKTPSKRIAKKKPSS